MKGVNAMLRHKVLFILLALFLVLSLAACGSSKEAVDEEKQASTTEPENAGTRELVVMGLLGGGDVDELIKKKEVEIEEKNITRVDLLVGYNIAKVVNEQFKKQNVDLKDTDWGWSEPLVQKETAAFIAKQGPDIIIGETQSPGFAAEGLLEPFPDWLDKEIRGNIVEGAWKPMEIDGKIYGVATQPGVSNLYWNKKLFEKAGLDPDTPPRTWQDMLDMSRKIFEAGDGEFYAGGIYAGPNNGGYLRFGALPLLSGGGWVDENNKPIFNDPKNVLAFEFLRELNKYNPEGLMANNTEAPFWEAFQTDQIAFVMDGPWRAQICRDLGQECGMTTLPLPSDGKPGNITIGASFNSVPVYAKNKEDAFKYIQMLMDKEVQQIIADSDVRPTMHKFIAESDDYKENHPAMYSVYQGLQGNVKGLPTFDKDNSKAWDIYGEAMVKAMMTDTPIKDILNEAQEKVLKVVQ